MHSRTRSVLIGGLLGALVMVLVRGFFFFATIESKGRVPIYGEYGNPGLQFLIYVVPFALALGWMAGSVIGYLRPGYKRTALLLLVIAGVTCAEVLSQIHGVDPRDRGVPPPRRFVLAWQSLRHDGWAMLLALLVFLLGCVLTRFAFVNRWYASQGDHP